MDLKISIDFAEMWGFIGSMSLGPHSRWLHENIQVSQNSRWILLSLQLCTPIQCSFDTRVSTFALIHSRPSRLIGCIRWKSHEENQNHFVSFILAIDVPQKRTKSRKNPIHRAKNWPIVCFECNHFGLLLRNRRTRGIQCANIQSVWFCRHWKWWHDAAICWRKSKSKLQINPNNTWIKISHWTILARATRMPLWTWTVQTICRSL